MALRGAVFVAVGAGVGAGTSAGTGVEVEVEVEVDGTDVELAPAVVTFLLTSKASLSRNSSFFLVFSCCSASSLLKARASFN